MKNFIEYIINHHPDPDSLATGSDNKFDQFVKLAQAYADAQGVDVARWIVGKMIDEPDFMLRHSDSELLQKYREQNK